MEQLVVTLETAKKLKAAGFPQEYGVSRFRWYEVQRKTTGEIESYIHPLGRDHTAVSWRTLDTYEAPTAQEIADQLDRERVKRVKWSLMVAGDMYVARLEPENSPTGTQWNIVGNTMAEALALLWLKLQS